LKKLDPAQKNNISRFECPEIITPKAINFDTVNLTVTSPRAPSLLFPPSADQQIQSSCPEGIKGYRPPTRILRW